MDSPWKIQPGFFGTGPENIHVIKNFIDEKDAATIASFARTINEWSNGSDEDIFDENGVCTYSAAYWNDRQCTWEILQRINKDVYDLIDFYLDKMAITAGEIFGCKLQKRPPCIVRWFKGIEQRPHADKQMNDGSPNPFPTYDINSLFYWNDDFEGGELYYPQHDIVVKPEPGLAVIHPGDINYLHGVKLVTGGERYTSPAFFTVE